MSLPAMPITTSADFPLRPFQALQRESRRQCRSRFQACSRFCTNTKMARAVIRGARNQRRRLVLAVIRKPLSVLRSRVDFPPVKPVLDINHDGDDIRVHAIRFGEERAHRRVMFDGGSNPQAGIRAGAIQELGRLFAREADAAFLFQDLKFDLAADRITTNVVVVLTRDWIPILARIGRPFQEDSVGIAVRRPFRPHVPKKRTARIFAGGERRYPPPWKSARFRPCLPGEWGTTFANRKGFVRMVNSVCLPSIVSIDRGTRLPT